LVPADPVKARLRGASADWKKSILEKFTFTENALTVQTILTAT
jgi:hypothetical protein